MLKRFARIYREFGRIALAKTLLMFFGLLGMAILDALWFASPFVLAIGVVGLAFGWLLRGIIVERMEWWAAGARVAFVIYGIVLFLGEQLGVSVRYRLIIIAVTTVVALNLEFWTLSDPAIINTERDVE